MKSTNHCTKFTSIIFLVLYLPCSKLPFWVLPLLGGSETAVV